MKKIYTAPEAELLCFRPVETIATDMDDLLGNGKNDPATKTDSDVVIDW